MFVAKTMKKPMTLAIVAVVSVLSIGQFAAADVSKEELKSISTPDKVKTSIGELKFFDGVPTDDTVKKVYDNLDRMRGVQVFLNTIGGASGASVPVLAYRLIVVDDQLSAGLALISQ